MMLPHKMLQDVIVYPKKRNAHIAIEKIKELKSIGYDDEELHSMIISQEDAMEALEELNIPRHTVFYEFYLNGFNESNYKLKDDILYGLCEILEAYRNPHPLYAQYPQIGKRYLQISSPEGEHSYFYDKETDAVYSVDWSQLDDLNAGKLKPMFNSFYDFLEWYYDEEEDDT